MGAARRVSPGRRAGVDPLVRATVAALASAAALHVVWGLRIDVPGVDGARVAEAVGGTGPMPGPGACFAVAGALTSAAALVAGVPANHRGFVRAGRVGVAVALGGRAALGLSGRAGLVAPGELTDSFRRWDRILYTPLCAGLAAGALRAIALDAR